METVHATRMPDQSFLPSLVPWAGKLFSDDRFDKGSPVRRSWRRSLRDGDRAPASFSSEQVEMNNPDGDPTPPRCPKCGKPKAYVTSIARVTEPGQVRVFECKDCQKLEEIEKMGQGGQIFGRKSRM